MADIIEEIPLDAEEVVESEPIPEKKKKGRPAGVKNKVKVSEPPEIKEIQETKATKEKPVRAKAKPKPRPPSPESPEVKKHAKQRAPKRRRSPSSSEDEVTIDTNEIAARVLGILQSQRGQRSSARQQHYAQWFANM